MTRPGSPAALADQAAEAIRTLNHATMPWAGELTEPADVYAVLGSLATLAARLPQVLSQLQVFLAREQAAGRVQIVDGQHAGDPAAAVTDLGHALSCAAGRAEALHHALKQAHATVTWAARTDTSDTAAED